MKRVVVFSALALSLTVLSGTSQASIIFSENFDTVPVVLNTTGTIGNFTVTSGNVDIVGTNPTNNFGSLCVAPESVNCVDLDGNTEGQITSAVITLPIGSYALAFDLNGSQRGNTTSTTVTFATFSHTYTLLSGDTNSFSVPITITTAGTSQIVFTSNTPGGLGSLIDNVSVTSVPEPASILLMMGALSLLLIVRHWQRAEAPSPFGRLR
jgi:hypothetical protein